MNADQDELVFSEDELPDSAAAHGLQPGLHPWRVLIVDDDQDVHEATRFAMHGLRVLDRSLEFLHAHSAAAALDLLAREQDIAAVLLDVVMETVTAGLDMIGVIRNDLGLANTRIVLRTGQPGHAPDVDTVRRYDINDYHTKTELTRGRLFVVLSTAIRAYDQLERTAANQHFLERVVGASQRLVAQPGLREFSNGLLAEIDELVGVPLQGLVYVISPDCATGNGCRVIAASPQYADCLASEVDSMEAPATAEAVRRCLETRRSVIEPRGLTLFLAGTQREQGFVVHVTAAAPLPPINPQLLDMFCSNVALGAEKVALTERLHRQAFFDALVELPNRNAFIEAVDRCLETEGGRGYVLALLDIDQFAEINDMFGHAYADRLLKAISGRLEDTLGGATIARVGTDTFGVLGRAELLPPQLLRAIFSMPFALDDSEHVVSVAIGLVRLDETHGQGADRLKDASIAVKRAKAAGHGQIAWFTTTVGHETRERTRLLHALREAFNYERLFPVYQPQLCLATGKIVGFEALLRWRTEDGRFVPPDTFIPIAENSGLIVSLGTWVLRMALNAARELRLAGLDDFHMAVNVSVVQFRHPDFLATLDAALADSGTRPQDLELEITESVAMIGATSIEEMFAALKSRGVGLAIDDFGTGFSSLSYLDRLPADRIKIDRSFVWALDSGQRGERIAEMVIPLGRQLGMKVLAEGVESQQQVERLKALGCDEGQGYLFAKPLPLEDVKQWIGIRRGAP